MTISEANPVDLEGLEPLARRFYASSKFLRKFDHAKFMKLWTEILESGKGVIFLLHDDHDVVGAIGGLCHPDAYSQDLVLQEMFWFVAEESRGAGARLYFKLEGWARDHGCAEIRMGFLHDSMPEKVGLFYRRLGFSAVETSFVKSLDAETKRTHRSVA